MDPPADAGGTDFIAHGEFYVRRRSWLTLASVFFLALLIQLDALDFRRVAFAQPKTIPAPADVLGFNPGDDRKLASWAKVVDYFQKLAAASDRVKFEEI